MKKLTLLLWRLRLEISRLNSLLTSGENRSDQLLSCQYFLIKHQQPINLDNLPMPIKEILQLKPEQEKIRFYVSFPYSADLIYGKDETVLAFIKKHKHATVRINNYFIQLSYHWPGHVEVRSLIIFDPSYCAS